MRRLSILAAVVLCSVQALAVSPQAPQLPSHVSDAPERAMRFMAGAATQVADLRAMTAQLDAGLRAGTLVRQREEPDTVLPGRSHERLQQLHQGVPVLGGQVVRQSADGQVVSIFGTLYPGIDVDPVPGFPASDAAARIEAASGGTLMRRREVQLLVLPLDDGRMALAYAGLAAGPEGVQDYYIDAHTGAVLLKLNHLQRQAAVGTGGGVLGDSKKISASGTSGGFVTVDALRPPTIVTYDLKGNWSRGWNIADGVLPAVASDRAFDADNAWTDKAVVDAHAYAGYVYDYYYKRFGRRGLNDGNRAIHSFVHPANRADALTVPDEIFDNFLVNAFFCGQCGYNGEDMMFYGDGVPDGMFSVNVNYFSGALDIVAHELTHGVTAYSSGLIYQNESGALNEAFSDIMGTSVEFYYQTFGSGPLKADYTMGEDVMPAIAGFQRSMANPRAFGDPDHYSLRQSGGGDNGGVHTNSLIASHAFYLAIEGGTNRTSGRTVQGVGASRREQIEKVFYRAFTNMLSAGATFYMARLATIQSAVDLYGGGGAVEQAVTQAWDAVGVVKTANLTFSFSPSPAPGRATNCGSLVAPCWPFTVTATETNGMAFNVTSTAYGLYDETGSLFASGTMPFSQYFASCGSASSRIPASGRACASLLLGLSGRKGGYVAFLISGADDNGMMGNFLSPALRLSTVSGAVPVDTGAGGLPFVLVK
jgi:bacillolysin